MSAYEEDLQASIAVLKMTTKRAAQHDWRAIADELYGALENLAYSPLREAYLNASEITDAEAALRRYEEARKRGTSER